MGPLSGIRILDMTTVLMGPSASQALGDMGAEVIKVESPEGDLIRLVGPGRNPGMGALFLNTNRSKRSICLDLKQPAGLMALKALLDTADVLIHNLRPKAMERLGLSYESLADRYPKLVYACLCGFSQSGPYADKAAYDDLIQGAAVLAALMARSGDGTPRYVPSALADRAVGLAAVGAICATLVHRERTGQGQKVEVAMFETMLGLVLGDHLAGSTFLPALPGEGYQRLLSQHRRPYATGDGHVCALVYNDRHWEAFLSEIGMSDLQVSDSRFANFSARTKHIDEVYAFLAIEFRKRTTAQWLEALERIDVPAMPMHDLQSVLEDPHLVATGFFEDIAHPSEGAIRSMASPYTWTKTPIEIIHLAPRQGQDGEAILREASFTPDQIQTLLDKEVLIVR